MDLKTMDERQKLHEVQPAQSDPSRPASQMKMLRTPVCLWAAGASPLYHFGLLFLWTVSEFEPWGCWSSSPQWRPCAGSAETHRQELMQPSLLLTINTATPQRARSAKKFFKKSTHVVFVQGYLYWVGIGCSLAGQAHWVRLGHRVVAVCPQQRVRMERRERQSVGALSSAGHVLWQL